MRKKAVEEPSASEVQVDVSNSHTDVLPVLPDTPEPSVELAQPSSETSVSEEPSIAEESLPQPSDSNTIPRPLTAVKVYLSRIRKNVDRFEPTWI